MGSQRWHRPAWCVLFACIAVGPHLLGANGEFDELPTSGTYGFVAFGLLMGLWTTSYPAVAALFRMRTARNLCAIVSLVIVCLVDLLGAFEHAYTLVLENGVLHAFLMSDSGMAYEWVLDLLAFAGSAAPYEKLLLFLGAFFCAVLTVDGGPSRASSCNAGHVFWGYGMALLACALAGIFRVQTWLVLCEAPAYFLFLWVVVFAWSLYMARFIEQRSCIAALCLGELIFRLASRLRVAVSLQAIGPWALCLSVICLVACCFVCRHLEHGRNSDMQVIGVSDAQCPLSYNRMLPWEKEAVQAAGLTVREVDVLEASLDGRSSQAAADALGMQSSTVRSYKGRICKKLGLDSFGQVIAARAAHQGVFEVPAARASAAGPVGQNSGHGSGPTCKRLRIGAGLRLLGCLGLISLVLMPSGRLARYWDATWLMAYGCAVGIVLGCAPAILRYLGVNMRAGDAAGKRRAVAVPLLFAVFGIACLAFHLLVEFAGLALGICQEMTLFVCVAGFVCFGTVELRFCIASGCLDPTEFGIACACVVAVVGAASLSGISWCVVAAALLACYIVGFALTPKLRTEAHMPDRPVSALSWFAVAFVWEECWRGVAYSSMQDVGLVCLVCLVVFSLRTLHGSGNAPHFGVMLANLACFLVMCVVAGLSCGLVMGVFIFDVQALHAWLLAQDGGETDQESSPALPSLLGFAAGCCVAVYVANARGSYILLHGDSILPGNLDWASLVCFGVSLAIVALRALCGPVRVLPDSLRNGRARLEGYLVGKGLSDNEVSVCVALAQGESVAQAAEALHYSTSHTSAIKRAAFAKLNVKTRRQFLSLLWKEFGQTQSSRS